MRRFQAKSTLGLSPSLKLPDITDSLLQVYNCASVYYDDGGDDADNGNDFQ